MISAAQQRTTNAAFFDFQEPIHILGAGSIGVLWAASIRSAFPSYPVQLLLRKHHQHRLLGGSKVAICVHAKHNNVTRRAPRTVQVPATLIGESKRPFQNLVVTTKAHQALPALTAVVDRISPQTRIILLCNGALAIRETLRDFLKERSRIHLAMTTHGAYRDDDDDELFHVVHAGYGSTSIEDYPAMAQLLDLAGLNCTTSLTLDRDLWYKLAANCVINPLTALYRCRNGEVRRSYEQRNPKSSFGTYMADILQEVSMVAHEMTGQEYPVETLQIYVETVINATSANQSSMFQDVLAGRDTEIDYLNGFVVQQGQQRGLLCPINQQLVQDVLALRNR
ncbi:2-dehydropantoate 2-reductase [Fistulifera solaris]|jgi:2-dehydropantoate 2-reductase|uniref:2-dehydropantoate 2-reductase n=1 Tax=Fistulifera solaris TaxID=1519565 RepID=A0A1Z5KP00_FISSO|nr:2-dehydropantoate 2-reductase [Fistulifera solaris]|eukprot:GAX28054.1 2-dehydropantoate 2-reductase [Fistulifera solaris]